MSSAETQLRDASFAEGSSDDWPACGSDGIDTRYQAILPERPGAGKKKAHEDFCTLPSLFHGRDLSSALSGPVRRENGTGRAAWQKPSVAMKKPTSAAGCSQ